MEHSLYIGKTLKELIDDCPTFALNFYLIGGCGDGYKSLKNIITHEACTQRIIKSISSVHSDYSIYIELEK